MIDRQFTRDGRRTPRLCRRRASGGPPRSGRGLARQASGGCRPRRRLARAGRRDPRALRRDRVGAGAGALRSRQAHRAAAALVARGRGGRGGRRVPDRRRRRLDGARRVGGRPVERSRSSPPKRSARTGSTSARCATRSRSSRRSSICCRGCRAASAPRCARPISQLRAQAARRPAAARPERAGGAVHVRERERRALHDLLLEDQGAADRVPLPRQPTSSARCTGSRAASAGW